MTCRITQVDIKAAKPEMLTRKTYDHVLAIGMTKVMDSYTVSFTPKPSRWPAIICVGVLVVLGYLMRGVI